MQRARVKTTQYIYPYYQNVLEELYPITPQRFCCTFKSVRIQAVGRNSTQRGNWLLNDSDINHGWESSGSYINCLRINLSYTSARSSINHVNWVSYLNEACKIQYISGATVGSDYIHVALQEYLIHILYIHGYCKPLFALDSTADRTLSYVVLSTVGVYFGFASR